MTRPENGPLKDEDIQTVTAPQVGPMDADRKDGGSETPEARRPADGTDADGTVE